jgi:hypothetical protein
MSRCSEAYDSMAVRAFRTYVGGLRPMMARQFCANRIYDTPGLERSRTYYLDPQGFAIGSQLEVSPKPDGNNLVCAKFFTFATGKSMNFLYQPGRDEKKLVVDTEGTVWRKSPKEDNIVIFLRDLSEYYQVSPDNNFIFLPFANRRVVHGIFIEQAPPEDTVHPTYFMQTWRKNPLCKHIKLRKHLRFALCDTCVEFRDLQLQHQTVVERMALKAAQLAHHQFVKAERQLYYVRRDRGVNEAMDAMSMIVDAADQQKYALPYHHIATHSSQKALRTPVHLMGVLVHGEAVHAYTYFENFKQGNNVTIQAIHDALADKLARDGTLPSVLFLQLDNTSKQCKSRYMIGWLGYLIQQGRFRSIVLSFLPVGHTHEDIDQVFSRLSVYLSCHDALNMEQLHKAIRQSYQTKQGNRAKCEFWDRCANFSEWIAPYLTNYDGISRYRQFRFFKVDGEVRVQAREHTSTKAEWAGIKGNDAYTPVFRQAAPSRMTNVPPTQRRDLLKEELVDKQVASIEQLATKRHFDLDLIADVITGVKSLGDEDDLPFNWTLSRLLNWNAPMAGPPVDGEGKDDNADVHAYEYPIDTICLVRPDGEGQRRFWLCKLVGLGEGARSGEYEVQWFERKGRMDEEFGRFKLCSQARMALSWLFETDVQQAVTMVAKGSKLSERSKTAVLHWIDRWEQEAADTDDDPMLELDNLPSDDEVDVD